MDYKASAKHKKDNIFKQMKKINEVKIAKFTANESIK
jgi:hypothetical protein